MRDLVYGFMAFDVVLIGVFWCVAGAGQLIHMASGAGIHASGAANPLILSILSLIAGLLVMLYAGAYLLNLVLARRNQPED